VNRARNINRKGRKGFAKERKGKEKDLVRLRRIAPTKKISSRMNDRILQFERAL